jgi:hypothetical protein
MGTLLKLRYSKNLPVELTAGLGSHSHISGQELSIYDVENVRISEITKLLQPLNKWLIFGPYFVPKRSADYRSSDVVGVVLGPGEVQGAYNSLSDFDPAWPLPCKGIVKQGIPLECRFKPKGHVEAIGDNLIFSKMLLKLLGEEKAGRTTNSVNFKGKLLENWVGFSFSSSCNIISPISFAPSTHCALCQSPYTPWRGVWLGNASASEINVCTDVIGVEHYQSRHPIVISKDLAITIDKTLGDNGLNLEVIYSLSSDYGKLIRDICNVIRIDHE